MNKNINELSKGLGWAAPPPRKLQMKVAPVWQQKQPLNFQYSFTSSEAWTTRSFTPPAATFVMSLRVLGSSFNILNIFIWQIFGAFQVRVDDKQQRSDAETHYHVVCGLPLLVCKTKIIIYHLGVENTVRNTAR